MTELLNAIGSIVGLLTVVLLLRAAWELGPALAYWITGKTLPKNVEVASGFDKDGNVYTIVKAADGRVLWAGPQLESEDKEAIE